MWTFNRDLHVHDHRWHLLEKSMGAAGGLVIDFDLAPPPEELDPAAIVAYGSREEALERLMDLRLRAEATPGLPGADFLRARLAGSEAYLRALLGERAPFERYLRQSMGIWPADAEAEAARLAEEQRELAEDAAALGLTFGPPGREEARRRWGRTDMGSFEAELRAAAEGWVGRLRRRLGLEPEPRYRLEVVSVDAYWANWIDGDRQAGVTLRVNTHPRIEYDRWSPVALAAHEIAGHAMHVACLEASATAPQPRLLPALLSLTVHAPEAFQMEGLAQAMLHLLAEPDELPAEQRFWERYRGYAGERANLAQLQVEAGAPIDGVARSLLSDCPYSLPLSLRSGLRDRSRNPLMRSYMHVYAPSRRLFLRAAALPTAAQDRILRLALQELLRPDTLSAAIAAEEAAAIQA
jgi:hypothetical protein